MPAECDIAFVLEPGSYKFNTSRVPSIMHMTLIFGVEHMFSNMFQITVRNSLRRLIVRVTPTCACHVRSVCPSGRDDLRWLLYVQGGSTTRDFLEQLGHPVPLAATEWSPLGWLCSKYHDGR